MEHVEQFLDFSFCRRDCVFSVNKEFSQLLHLLVLQLNPPAEYILWFFNQRHSVVRLPSFKNAHTFFIIPILDKGS